MGIDRFNEQLALNKRMEEERPPDFDAPFVPEEKAAATASMLLERADALRKELGKCTLATN